MEASFLLVMQHGKSNNRDKGWAKRLDGGWSGRSQSSKSDVLDANGDLIYQNEGPGKLYLRFRNFEIEGFTTELKATLAKILDTACVIMGMNGFEEKKYKQREEMYGKLVREQVGADFSDFEYFDIVVTRADAELLRHVDYENDGKWAGYKCGVSFSYPHWFNGEDYTVNFVMTYRSVCGKQILKTDSYFK